jgi:UDP-N-acetylmuramate: L-alanyl-gamma-D-glutamyl-meso-diaminopimelate ligase
MKIHLMAVGGTGMLALAGLLKAQGHEVTGCDVELYPPMSDYVARYGIPCATGFDPSHLDPRPDLVVIGNAIHADNAEARAVMDDGIPYMSMAEAIGKFAVEGRKSLVVTGTHGKTTTTALCGYLLERAGLRPNMIVGGVAKDFDSSFLWGGGEWTVLEGDEYETAFFDKGPKFLHYAPTVLILANIEMDHLDNFRDLGALETAFVRLMGVVKEDGVIIGGSESPSVAKLLPLAGRPVQTFGLCGGVDWSAEDVEWSSAGTRFRPEGPTGDLGIFESPLYGAHNLRDAVAALAACLAAGADLEALRAALPGFGGVKRRQEVVYEGRGVRIVDDFAHHPTALRETIAGLRQRFEPRRLIACFEPRSFTCQTKLHEGTLPGAFERAEVVFLGPIKHAARIPPGDRLDLGAVAAELAAWEKEAWVVTDADEYLERLPKMLREGDLVAFFSSGAFQGVPYRLAQMLAERDAGG